MDPERDALLTEAEMSLEAEDAARAAEILDQLGEESEEGLVPPAAWPATDRARYFAILGALALGEAEFDAAIDAYARAVDLQDDPIDKARALVDLAVAHADAGDEEEADGAFQRALSGYTGNDEHDPLEVAEAFVDFGSVWLDNEEFGRAANAFREACRRLEEAGEEARELGRAYALYGMAMRPLVSVADEAVVEATERAAILGDAERAYARALELLQKGQAPSEEILDVLRGYAEVLARSGKQDLALAQYDFGERVVSMAGGDPSELATLAYERGRALQLFGRDADARTTFERAIAVGTEGGVAAVTIARAWDALASTLDRLGEADKAVEARHHVEELGGIDDDSVDLTEFQDDDDEGGF